MGVYSYSYKSTDATARAGAVVDHLIILSVQAVIIVFLGLIVRHGQTPVMTARAGFISPVRQRDIRGSSTTVMSDDQPLPTLTPTATPTFELQQEPAEPAVLPHPASNPTKPSYTIAFLGDSMVDTMGEYVDYPEYALKKLYPNIQFKLYNYGIGSTNVEEALGRFYEPFSYKTRNYPPIDKIDADIIIVGSFGYNPKTPHDRNWHWLNLTRLIQEAQKTGADVYVLAEIAPLRADFGNGHMSVNWETQTAIKHSGRIVEQLQNAVGLAATLNLPLIDTFNPSRVDDKLEGKRKYVDPADGIHPSIKGHEFMADIIASSIVLR